MQQAGEERTGLLTEVGAIRSQSDGALLPPLFSSNRRSRPLILSVFLSGTLLSTRWGEQHGPGLHWRGCSQEKHLSLPTQRVDEGGGTTENDAVQGQRIPTSRMVPSSSLRSITRHQYWSHSERGVMVSMCPSRPVCRLDTNTPSRRTARSWLPNWESRVWSTGSIS